MARDHSAETLKTNNDGPRSHGERRILSTRKSRFSVTDAVGTVSLGLTSQDFSCFGGQVTDLQGG